jgi:hypothetical protein
MWREHAFHCSDLLITPSRPVIIDERGIALEITATFQLGTAAEYGITLHTGDMNHTMIGYDTNHGQLFIDRTQSEETGFNPAFSGRGGGPWLLCSGASSL